MMRAATLASLLALSIPPATAQAQEPAPVLTGTRLDVTATGEVSKVPDIARIDAGVVTQAASAGEAMAQNAQRMGRVVAALRKAGIAERDIQTNAISLNPQYRYADNQAPVLTGYQASNDVTVRFRDIATTGPVLDALVGQGANQISGPVLGIDKPDQALDEARRLALAGARARADLYARALGKSVKRIVSISESGGAPPSYPVPMMRMMAGEAAQTKIAPGEQALSVSLAVIFELE